MPSQLQCHRGSKHVFKAAKPSNLLVVDSRSNYYLNIARFEIVFATGTIRLQIILQWLKERAGFALTKRSTS